MSQRITKQYITHGVSAFYVLCNVSYAGMRAQNLEENKYWRYAAFIGGFGWSFATLITVQEGSKRAYGIDLPINKQIKYK